MEDRLGLLFDFVLLFPSEPHLLRQSGSQVQGEGRKGGGVGGGWGVGSEENPAERETETGEQAGKPSRGHG